MKKFFLLIPQLQLRRFEPGFHLASDTVTSFSIRRLIQLGMVYYGSDYLFDRGIKGEGYLIKSKGIGLLKIRELVTL